MFSFVQDAEEAEGDKDAMKRMFTDTDVSQNNSILTLHFIAMASWTHSGYFNQSHRV